jgi:hypothetical protein
MQPILRLTRPTSASQQRRGGAGPCDAWSFVRIRRTKCVRPTLAFLYARLGARYSLTAASSTVSTASGDASSRSLGIALPLLSDSP